MNALITGMNGTVAPMVAACLVRSGHSVTAWDRAVVPTDQPDAVRDFILRTKPDWLFHIAMGSADWAEMMARVCAEQGIKFLFTSTVSVYAGTQQGPFTVDVAPEPNDDYGRYKMDCERRIRAVCPAAIIARLGWQIGTAAGSNNMIDFLEKAFRGKGQIEASHKGIPSCAMLPDTAACLVRLMQEFLAGLYHLEGNPGLNFHEIVTRLNRLRGNPWVVVPNDSHVQNNRMLDDRIPMNPITRTLA